MQYQEALKTLIRSRTIRLPRQEVELIINDLLLQRLIIKEEKKRRFFGWKKIDIRISDAGTRIIHSKKQELEQQTEQLRQWQRNGDTAQLQSYMESITIDHGCLYAVLWNYECIIFYIYDVYDGNGIKPNGKPNSPLETHDSNK
jgi:hypothetical protein